jgi:transcriptional regulator of acetoin/glycerol metabolism
VSRNTPKNSKNENEGGQLGSRGKTADFGDVITASWDRCRAFGLSHGSLPTTSTLSRTQRQQLKEQHDSLVPTTECEVLPYYENILSNSQCLILLTDKQGQVLSTWGDQCFIEPDRKAFFVEGTNWQEQINGTNAIGTALACGHPVQVQRNEHFLKANRFMIGSAAPIFDVHRHLIGVLNVSSDAYLPQAHTLGMVRLMSQSVENRLMVKRFSGDCYLLTFNTNVDNVDSQWSGLIAFDGQCRILAANRRAEQLLGQSFGGLAMTDILECPASDLLDRPDLSKLELKTRINRGIHALLRTPANGKSGASTTGSASAGRTARSHAGRSEPGEEGDRLTLDNIEFGDRQMARCIEQARKLIDKDIPILIHGETGAGKEVFVKALHQSSRRRHAPLVAVNCAAIPAELVESELFGYEKGAFTGASPQGAIGLIRKADHGVLFLDEVGEMPMGAQARLLRVLQEREVTPLGSTERYPVDIKLVSATNQPLRNRIATGDFRPDLYYRITGLDIELPALRHRDDLREVCRRIHAYHRETDQPGALPAAILDIFERHPWPGNVRQLSNVIQVALAMAGHDPIQVWHLPDDFIRDIDQSAPQPVPVQRAHSGVNSNDADDESSHLLEVYSHYQGNISRTARHLSISRNTLYKRLKALGIRS